MGVGVLIPPAVSARHSTAGTPRAPNVVVSRAVPARPADPDALGVRDDLALAGVVGPPDGAAVGLVEAWRDAAMKVSPNVMGSQCLSGATVRSAANRAA
ncbi:hypothetical protein GCM10009681_54940 [Luedemannella helvata]|uniref:Uncharacterized protein n=1 Tax=Luedemannella helvata TaxID=349315 RepID=A0ABN2L671_9ACTN